MGFWKSLLDAVSVAYAVHTVHDRTAPTFDRLQADAFLNEIDANYARMQAQQAAEEKAAEEREKAEALAQLRKLRDRAGQWLELGKFEKAILQYTHLIDLLHRSPQAMQLVGTEFYAFLHVDRGNAYRLRGDIKAAGCNGLDDYHAAVGDLIEGVRLLPDSSAASLRLGFALHRLKRYDEAVQWFRHAADLEPKTLDAHYGLGITHLDQGDPRSALAPLETALRINAEHSGVKTTLQQARRSLSLRLTEQGAEQTERGEYSEALGTLTEALGLDSGNAAAFSERALAYLALSALDKACADFDEAIRLDPDLGLAYQGRAIIYHKRGDLDKAIADLREAVRCDPEECEVLTARLDLAELYCERAHSHLDNRELQNAIDDYTAAMSVDHHGDLGDEIFLWRAEAYRQNGEFAKAAADYSTAMQMWDESYPGDPKERAAVLRSRAECCLGLDQFEQGVADFKAAAKLDPLPDTGLSLEKLLEDPLAHVERLLTYEALRPGQPDWKQAVTAADQFRVNEDWRAWFTLRHVLVSKKRLI